MSPFELPFLSQLCCVVCTHFDLAEDDPFSACWVFGLAALLLKQISLFCKLELMFQHVLRHFYKMLDTMFQHPGTIQCVWVHAYLYARSLLFKETIFPYLIVQATRISLRNQLWNIPKVVIIF